MKERQSKLDIIRIVSMCGICCLHILGAGGVINSYDKTKISYWVIFLIDVCAYASVNIFGLLSGYLGFRKANKSSRRAIELLFIVLFYSILFTVLYAVIKPDRIDSYRELLISIFPQTGGRLWYITCYIPVAILQPFINKMLQSIDIEEHYKLSVVSVVLFSILPTITNIDLFRFEKGYSFAWLLCLYIIGAYIRRVVDDKKRVPSRKTLIVVYLLAILSTTLINYITFKLLDKQFILVTYTSPIILLTSIILILLATLSLPFLAFM